MKKTILTDLSTRDLKRLLAARERIDVLEAERKRLSAELARVDKELDALLTGKSVGAKKTVGKKVRGRKKATAGKTAPRKKAGRKKVVKKKVARKTAKKAGSRKSAAPRVKLEDVVLAVLQKKGNPMAFKDLYEAIVGGKLFRSKSKNFDNVLRRTLSTSKLVKRVGRGVYDAA